MLEVDFFALGLHHCDLRSGQASEASEQDLHSHMYENFDGCDFLKTYT